MTEKKERKNRMYIKVYIERKWKRIQKKVRKKEKERRKKEKERKKGD